MKIVKIASMITAAVIGCTSLAGCSSSNSESDAGNEKLNVCASFYAVADFAEKVGGDKVTVTNLVPAGEEPHDWEPTPQDIVTLEKADVFVYSGLGFEHWTEDVLGTLKNDKLTVAVASNGVATIAGHSHEEDERAEDEHDEDGDHDEHDEHDEDDEHDHGDTDPHVWLAPLNAKIEMENIKNALIAADPDNKDYYEANYTKYAAEFDKLDKEYSDTLSPLTNKKIVVSHEAFGYLCTAYGLEQHGVDGLTPESEPDAARVAEIIDLVNNDKIKVIFFEELVSSKIADSIASQTGAQTGVLSTIEGLTDEQLSAGGDYFSVMRENLTALKNALS